MGTGSSEFLVEEYELVKEDFACGKPESAGGREPRRKALKDSLVKMRDEYITGRIDETLRAEVKQARSSWGCFTPWVAGLTKTSGSPI